MRWLRLSVIGVVVVAWWVSALRQPPRKLFAGIPRGAAAQPAAVAKATQPFTAEGALAPEKVYWDGDTLRIDIGAQTISGSPVKEYNGAALPASYQLLFHKTRRWYTVVPSVPQCSYAAVPAGRLGCHNPLIVQPLPKASAKTKITVLGEGTVEGLRCTVERMTSSDPKVAPPGGVKLWILADLGMVVKMEAPGPNGKPKSMIFLDKITVGKPDPKLFIPPAYCKYLAAMATTSCQ